jgi:hypothetical protein
MNMFDGLVGSLDQCGKELALTRVSIDKLTARIQTVLERIPLDDIADDDRDAPGTSI